MKIQSKTAHKLQKPQPVERAFFKVMFDRKPTQAKADAYQKSKTK